MPTVLSKRAWFFVALFRQVSQIREIERYEFTLRDSRRILGFTAVREAVKERSNSVTIRFHKNYLEMCRQIN
jgi:hypothetical protein